MINLFFYFFYFRAYYSINILKNPSQDPFTLAEGGIFWTFPNRFGNKVLKL